MKIKFTISLILFFIGSFFLNAQETKDAALKKIQPYLYENPDKAIQVANEMIASETNTDKKINLYLYLSKAYTAKRNSDESYKALLKAQDLLETSKNIDSKINVLTIIAIQYQQMELYNKSFEVLDEVDALCQSLNPELSEQKNTALGKSYATKGIIYKSQGNFEIALEKFFTSIQYFEKAKSSLPTINNISIVYYNIGYSYVNLERYSEAEKYFHQSLDFANKSDAQSLQAYAKKGLAENFTFQNQPQKSIELLKEAEQKSQKIGDLVLNEGIYKGLAENYLSIGNFQDYEKYNGLYLKVQFEREQNELKSINSLLNYLDQSKKDKIAKLDQKYVWITLFIIAFGFLISGILLRIALRKNRENNRKKREIQELISS